MDGTTVHLGAGFTRRMRHPLKPYACTRDAEAAARWILIAASVGVAHPPLHEPIVRSGDGHLKVHRTPRGVGGNGLATMIKAAPRKVIATGPCGRGVSTRTVVARPGRA